MSFYSRLKLATNSFHNAISPRNYGGFISSSSSVCTGKKSSTPFTPFSFLHSSSNSNPLLSQTSVTEEGKKITQFENPPNESDHKWLSKSSKWLILSTVLVSFYYMNFEIVPFTKRSRFVFFPSISILEKELGKVQMKHQIMASWVVLPTSHPHSIRAGKIFDEIIKGLKMAIDDEKDAENREGRMHSTTKHLNKLNWEILVIDDSSVLLTSLPGGTILINSWFLERIKSDTQLAALIAHEVARVVARHYAEELATVMRRNIIMGVSVFPYLFFSYVVQKPEVVDKIGYVVGELKMCKVRNAAEADEIAVMLMSWAGYDPQIAVETYRGYGDLFRRIHTNYPSGKERARILQFSRRMGLAVAAYKKKQATGSSGEGKATEAKTEPF